MLALVAVAMAIPQWAGAKLPERQSTPVATFVAYANACVADPSVLDEDDSALFVESDGAYKLTPADREALADAMAEVMGVGFDMEVAKQLKESKTTLSESQKELIAAQRKSALADARKSLLQLLQQCDTFADFQDATAGDD